jgi:hypothetical protein
MKQLTPRISWPPAPVLCYVMVDKNDKRTLEPTVFDSMVDFVYLVTGDGFKGVICFACPFFKRVALYMFQTIIDGKLEK